MLILSLQAPEGCILINDVPNQIWTSAALDISNEIGMEAEKRDPDAQDVGPRLFAA